MPSVRRGLSAVIAYTAIIALASLLLSRVPGGGDARTALMILLPFQLIALGVCFPIMRQFGGWAKLGFGRLYWRGLVWFLPAWAVLGLLFWEIVTGSDQGLLPGWNVLGLTALVGTTFLIALGEEIVFRGLLLRGMMARFSVPVSMLASALFFGAFHLVNGLAGQGAINTSNQMLFAVIVGFFLGPIAVRVGNLWPLILWHWLWNIAVILGQTGGILAPLALAGLAVQAVVAVWLWAGLTRQMAVH